MTGEDSKREDKCKYCGSSCSSEFCNDNCKASYGLVNSLYLFGGGSS